MISPVHRPHLARLLPERRDRALTVIPALSTEALRAERAACALFAASVSFHEYTVLLRRQML